MAKKMERQCRVCGEWHPAEKMYPPSSPSFRIPRWCGDCYRTYSKMYKSGYGKSWIKSEQEKWDYQSRKVAPDREVK